MDQRYANVVSDIIFSTVIRNLPVMTSDIWANNQTSFKGMAIYHYPLLLLSFYPIEHIPEMIVYDSGRKSLWRGRCPNERRWYTT
jgi:hypothetical protein